MISLISPSVKSKLPNAGTTIFTEMSVLAQQFNAVNLGQGFPDFQMDEGLISLVNRAMQKGQNQYVHMNGLPALRQALAEKVQSLYGSELSTENDITVTPGGTYALYTALTAILEEDDEVIIFQPAYDSYIPAIELNGAKVIPVDLRFPNYKINWAEVREKITEKTKAIMINSPHNPTGAVLGEDDIAELSAIVADTNIFIISDEVYEHIIFDGKKHLSLLKYPELFKRSFICFSFGKVYHCTGWKLGYCMAPAALMKEFRKIHQFNAFTVFGPAQYALAEFVKNENAYLLLGNFLQSKRDYFSGLMQQTKFKPLPSHGSYFQLYDYSSISDENEKDFSIRLTKENGVTTIPVSAFYAKQTDNKVLRFCFAKKEETLEAAAERLVKL